MRDGSDLGGFVCDARPPNAPDPAWERQVKKHPVLDTKAFRAAVRETRYVVERRPGSWFWKRWHVRPVSATGAVFAGTEYQCLSVQQSLHCAASNGAWVALSPEYHS